MSHYSEHEQRQLDEYNRIAAERNTHQTEEECFGSPHTTPGQKGAYLCPQGTYLDLDTDEIKVEGKPLKESEGKAQDARYCFLADIGDVMSSGKTRDIGKLLSLIVRGVEESNITKVKHHCSEVMAVLSDEHSMNDLIGVRAQALASGKYSFESYREEIDVNLLLDAAARHFLKILFVSNTDEESGYPHTAHIAANVIMIHTQLKLHK